MAVYCERLSLCCSLYCMCPQSCQKRHVLRSAPPSHPAGGRASRATTMTNGGSSSAAPLLPLSYAMHSGGGVQLQALTNAIFLANATGRRLCVRRGCVAQQYVESHVGPDGYLHGRKCKTPYIDMSKQQINALSENMLCGLCDKLPEGRLESFREHLCAWRDNCGRCRR